MSITNYSPEDIVFSGSYENSSSFERRQLLYNYPFVNFSDKDGVRMELIKRLLPSSIVNKIDISKLPLTNWFIFLLAICQSGGASFSQLKYLGLCVGNDANIRVNLGRKKDFLSSKKTSNGTFYYLSKSKRNEILNIVRDSLYEELLYGNFIGDTEDMRFTESTYLHMTGSNDLRYFLVGYLDFPYFSYSREVDVMRNGSVSFGEVSRQDVGLRADAYFTFLNKDMDIVKSFVEVDSGKQGRGDIRLKIDSYVECLMSNLSDLEIGLVNIDFSILDTRNRYSKVSEKTTMTNNNVSSAKLSCAIVKLFMYEYGCVDFGEVLNVFEQNEKKKYSLLRRDFPAFTLNDFKNAHELLKKHCVIKDESNVEMLLKLESEDMLGASLSKAQEYKAGFDEYFDRRCKFFKDVITSHEGMRGFMERGLSINLLPNHNLYSVFPFVYLAESKLLNNVLGDELEINYSIEISRMRLYFKLMYLFKGIKYCVENISHDIGGFVRASEFLKYVSEKNMKLVCVVKDKNDAAQFILDNVESKGVVNGLENVLFVEYEDVFYNHYSPACDEGCRLFRFVSKSFIVNGSVSQGLINSCIEEAFIE